MSSILFGLLLAHLFTLEGGVKNTGRLHYLTHLLYARLEPAVIKLADYMAESPFFTGNPLGLLIFKLIAHTNKLLPHGVVIPFSAAVKIVKDIEKHSRGEAHIAVGPCVCQRVLGRFKDPVEKDITIWYGAEIYKQLFPEGYRFISAGEAEEILRECRDRGLVQTAEFLMQSRKWFFVICNCDAEVCCPTRVFRHTGGSLYPGPFIARQEREKCKGVEECGACLRLCHFNANREENGKSLLQPDKCLGCGLCVAACQGKARTLERRPGYRGRLLPLEYLETGE